MKPRRIGGIVRRARAGALVLLFLVFAAAIAPAAAAESVSPSDSAAATPAAVAAPVLSGTVRDADGKPLAGATVRALPTGLSMAQRERHVETWIDPVVVRTGEDGSFSVSSLAGEAFTVRVEASRHAPWTERGVARGARLVVHLERGTTLRGRTLSSGGGDSVAGASVQICDEAASSFGLAACARVTSGEQGEFTCDAVPAEPVLVRAVAEGRAASRVLRIEDPAQPIRLELGLGAWLHGRVVDQRGEAVSGARIRVTGAAGPRHRQAADAWPVHSDETGAFTLEGLEAGERCTVLAFRADRPAAQAGPFEIEAGRDLDVVLRLPASAKLAFGLLDPDGLPVEAFDVYLQDAGAPDDFGPLARRVDESSIRALDDGRFALDSLGAGRLDVLIVPEGYAAARRDGVALVAGETTDLGQLTLERGRTLEGRVLDPDGVPIAGAELRVWDGGPLDARARRARSDAEGRFEIAGLREQGPATLYGQARGYSPKQVEIEEDAEQAELILVPVGGLAGKVETRDGEPPPAFTIFVHAEAGGSGVGIVKQQSFAAGDGSWRIEELGEGRYTVEARARGWAPGRREDVTVSGADLVEVPPIVLERGLALAGRVVAAADGRPVEGADVQAIQETGWIPREGAAGARTRADASGRFELGGLEPGSTTVRASYPGFAPAEVLVQITAEGPPADVLLEMTAGGRIRGTVRDREGRPLEGRALMLVAGTDLLGHGGDTTATNADGAYEFEHVSAGSHTLRLLPGPSDAFAVITKTTVLDEGEIAVVDFVPDPLIHLSGFVLRGGEPLPRSSLFFTRADSFDLTSVKLAQARDDGAYEIGLDAPGRYRVIVQTGPTGGSSTEIDVPDQERATRDVVLESAGIAGTVTNEDGEPVPGTAVAARNLDASAAPDALFVAEADEAGRYAIQGLREGTYRVTAVAQRYRMGDRTVLVEEGGAQASVDFVLERGGTLRGRLVDPQGNGVGGAYVFAASSAAPDPLNPASAETDLHGNFEMTVPADGPLDLSAFAAGWAPARATHVELQDDAPADALVLMLDRGGRVRVHVVDGKGQPLPRVPLTVRAVPPFVGSEIGRLLRPAPPTGADGVTTIELLSPGTWEVAAGDRSGAVPVRVDVTAGVERQVELTLP